MRRPILLITFISSTLVAQISGVISGNATSGNPTGIPAVSVLKATSSASTIAAQFASTAYGSPSMSCTDGTTTYTSKDSAVVMGTGIVQQQIAAGLTASTSYTCTITVTNGSGSGTAVLTKSTTTAAASTPITGATYGSVSAYNTVFGGSGYSMGGDTFYNCVGPDNVTYLETMDTNGYVGGGNPVISSALQIVKFTGTFPATVATLNGLANYGGLGHALAPSGGSMKSAGIFCMAGNQFITEGRQEGTTYPPTSFFSQIQGAVLWSPDRWASMNSWQSQNQFTSGGNPATSAMFNASGTWPSSFASAAFVMYCGDDGTLGYFDSCTQHDNGDAFVYLISNEHSWQNGSIYYIARVPRAKLANLNVSDYQCFLGGDGNLDANWGSCASAVAIVTQANQLGEPNVQYVPALNRYILLSFYYPNQANYPTAGYADETVWPVYEAPHPWGPWTRVGNLDWPVSGTPGTVTGYYNPVILNSSIWSGTTPWILFSGNFTRSYGVDYQMFWAQMTITH